MLNENLIKEEFDDIKNVHYLNIASLAMPPKSVQKAYQGFMRDYISFFGADVKDRFSSTMEEARGQLALLINSEPSEIGFVKNTSEGIGIIANGYAFMPGDNIIITDQEHGANKNVWIELQKKGLVIKVVPTVNKDILLEDIKSRIDKNTKAIAIASVQYGSGIRSDLITIGQICKEHSLLFIVDAIQSIGRLKLDVKEANIDYLACGGHKGLLGTYGVGFIYCRSDLIKEVIPPYSCHQSALILEEDGKHLLKWRKDSRKVEAGCLNYAGIAAMNAGAKLLNELGIEAIENHILNLEKELIERIEGLPYTIRNPSDPDKRSGILCLEYPPKLKSTLEELFIKRDIFVTFRMNYIRISFGLYNTLKDVKAVASALEDALDLDGK